MTLSKFFPTFLLLPFLLIACSTPRPQLTGDPREYIQKACGIGEKISLVEGNIWMKAESSENTGQFPASVRAQAPGSLDLEVTNLVGGSEASIEVRGERIQIRVPGKKPKVFMGQGSWGGVPLQWATTLMLGRFPCPPSEKLASARLSLTESDAVTVEVGSKKGTEDREIFVYRFKMEKGNLWPQSLHWEKTGAKIQSVDFEFEQADEENLSPTKWTARSEKGEVKVRWKKRNVRLSQS